MIHRRHYRCLALFEFPASTWVKARDRLCERGRMKWPAASRDLILHSNGKLLKYETIWVDMKNGIKIRWNDS